MADRYPVLTIVDIAKIPEEAFPRFLEEFPMMVAAMRAHIGMMRELLAAGAIDHFDDAVVMETIKDLRWIDDDKGNIRVSVSMQDVDGKKTPFIDLKANHKTGAVDFSILGEKP